MINVVIDDVRMPFTSLPVKNALVENFELTTKDDNSRVYSVLDTNEADPGTSQVVTKPSKFKGVEVERQNAEIGGQSVLRLTVQAFYKEALSLDTREVFLQVRVPVSAGQIRGSTC